ncbi:MAG: hypothetical protein ACD_47C00603G0001 [uncultured bacterium]|nr:MAG: hypothetical protein ACD_47C00603G0001 [uncultured bacterium]
MRFISPISSRKIVPLSASSNFPILSAVAPVKAPFLWPNSSDSRSVSGIAAQFIFTNGFFALSLLSCMSRATSSLPVPDSPVINTVVFEPATLVIISKTPLMAALAPMKLTSSETAFSAAFSSTRRVCSSAFFMRSLSSSGSNGFNI